MVCDRAIGYVDLGSGQVKLKYNPDQEPLEKMEAFEPSAVSAFSPYASIIARGRRDGSIIFQEMSTGKVIGTIRTEVYTSNWIWADIR